MKSSNIIYSPRPIRIRPKVRLSKSCFTPLLRPKHRACIDDDERLRQAAEVESELLQHSNSSSSLKQPSSNTQYFKSLFAPERPSNPMVEDHEFGEKKN